jgi:nitroimidazol reductase NimA-like FMN-containing flavoprotein (pyridoxamine 5'-phosphate oxidase superfamily)
MAEESSVVELTHEACWEMLRTEELGRLAFRIVDEVHITPINYVVDGGSLFFATAEGTKLLAVAMGSSVALEVDRVDDVSARSVVVRGTTRLLREDEADRILGLPLRTWTSTLKYDVVEIVPEVVTGRQFELVRPWLFDAN